jgi:hypothetical protein
MSHLADAGRQIDILDNKNLSERPKAGEIACSSALRGPAAE